MIYSHVNRFSTTAVFMLFFQAIIAQTYTFSKLQDTYQNLVNPVSVTDDAYWDEFSYFYIPFQEVAFPFYGNQYDSLYVGAGSVSFNVTIDDELINFSGQEIGVFATFVELRERGDDPYVSPIGYTLTGQAGARIFKLEWRNAGLVNDETGTNFVNIQLWLYEGSGIIEMRYGPSSVTNSDVYFPGTNGPLVGFYDDNPADGYYLSGNPSTPTLGTFPPFPALNGVPANGTVYRFTPSTSSVNSLQAAGYQIYPNPFSDWLRVEHPQQIKAGTFRLTDITGRTILYQQYDSDQQLQFSTEQLNPGMYILELQIAGKRLQSKVIKSK